MASPEAALETVIVSDMHLADAEPESPDRPLWRAYKQRRFFFDEDFARLLEHVDAQATGPVELILNGDIFDFDSITQLPEDRDATSWLAGIRGLPSEEWCSGFKMDLIVRDHPAWFAALGAFLGKGHRAVFVIGNHDAELHWPSVQAKVKAALQLDPEAEARVRFVIGFYLSGEESFVSHGHLYDALCTEKTPIDPLILVHGRPRVRLPFGDMAMRYMLNGMGYFNPHAAGNYVMTARQYFVFFFKYLVRDQPLMVWTWFWSAFATLVLSLRDFWRPEMRDPLLVEEKTESIAERANTTPAVVRRLMALNEPSACTDPLTIARVLWLDRGFAFLLMLYLAAQLTLAVHFVWPISPWWGLLFLLLLFPLFLSYSFRVSPQDTTDRLLTEQRATHIHEITGRRYAIFGHTHRPTIRPVGPMIYVNGGFWSAAFKEPTCEHRIGTQTFVWLPANPDGGPRTPALWEWPPGAEAPRPYQSTETPPSTSTVSESTR